MEEFILAAAENISELLGDVAVKKVGDIPLLASTTTRQTDEIAEITEAPLLERINESQWYVIQVDESSGADKKAINACFCAIYFSRGCAWG